MLRDEISSIFTLFKQFGGQMQGERLINALKRDT